MLGSSGSARSTPGRGFPPGGRALSYGPPITRQSNGLDQFFTGLQDRGSLALLDFAGASQENVSFITSMGHRLSSEDFVRAIDHTFGNDNPVENQSDPRLVDEFVSENLSFQPDSADG